MGYHGNVATGNLLIRNGKLSAVINIGRLAVADPAYDKMIALTLLKPSSRALLRERLGVSDAIRKIGRGWASRKTMIVVANMIETNTIAAVASPYAIDQIGQNHVARY